MCLIVFAFQQHPDYPLIVAANRDEYYQRPTATAHFWADQPQIFAGRDLEAKGTWLGVNRHGSFAALTNYREGSSNTPMPSSRGQLCHDYLASHQLPNQSPKELQQHYAGFNLITGDIQQLRYLSNRNDQPQALKPGIYGLSNGLLNSAWPKVTQSKQALQQLLAMPSCENLIQLMQDRTPAPDNQLPKTGIDIQWERLLSSRFIQTEHYGTRCSTALLFSSNGKIEFVEQSYTSTGVVKGQVKQLIQAR